MEISFKKVIVGLSQKIGELFTQSDHVYKEFAELRLLYDRNSQTQKTNEFIKELKRIQDNYDFFLHQMEKNLHLQRYQLAAINDVEKAADVAKQSELITQQVKWLKELQNEKLVLHSLLYKQEISAFRQKSNAEAVQKLKDQELESYFEQLQRKELDLKEEIEKIGTIQWNCFVP